MHSNKLKKEFKTHVTKAIQNKRKLYKILNFAKS